MLLSVVWYLGLEMWQHDNLPSTITYRLTTGTVPVRVSFHLLTLGLQMKHFFFEAERVSLKKKNSRVPLPIIIYMSD